MRPVSFAEARPVARIARRWKCINARPNISSFSWGRRRRAEPGHNLLGALAKDGVFAGRKCLKFSDPDLGGLQILNGFNPFEVRGVSFPQNVESGLHLDTFLQQTGLTATDWTRNSFRLLQACRPLASDSTIGKSLCVASRSRLKSSRFTCIRESRGIPRASDDASGEALWIAGALHIHGLRTPYRGPVRTAPSSRQMIRRRPGPAG
jgi:hypothetical protein